MIICMFSHPLCHKVSSSKELKVGMRARLRFRVGRVSSSKELKENMLKNFVDYAYSCVSSSKELKAAVVAPELLPAVLMFHPQRN